MAQDHIHPSSPPIELSFPFPNIPDTKIHIHLTIHSKSLIIHLAVRNSETSGTPPLGSFVVAIPNRSDPTHPVSTPLVNNLSTIDFATSIAKLLARKERKAVYVGDSIDFNRLGLSVEEVVDGQRRVVGVVLDEIKKAREQTNGVEGT